MNSAASAARPPYRSAPSPAGLALAVALAALAPVAHAAPAAAPGVVAPPAPGAPPAAASAPRVPEAGIVPVRVERARPRHESLATLRFLKDNVDFFRSRLDLLREKPLASRADAGALDPRFLAYRRMVGDALAAGDSLATLQDAQQRRDLLASVTDLGRLESELDQMDRVLSAQRTRLTALQADFTGRQRTALAVVVSGYPQGAPVSGLSLQLEDGDTLSVAFSADERASLERGGVLQVFHGLVEPREQLARISLLGAGWPAPDSAFVTLNPQRDRLTFLRIDLAPAQPSAGTASVAASTWLRDDGLSSNAEPSPER